MFLYLVRVTGLSRDMPDWGSAHLTQTVWIMFIKAAPVSASEYANDYILWQSLTSSAAFWLRTKDSPDTDTVAVLFSAAACSRSASCKQHVLDLQRTACELQHNRVHMTVWTRDYIGLYISSSSHSFSSVFPLKPSPEHFADVSTVHQTPILTNYSVWLEVKWYLL